MNSNIFRSTFLRDTPYFKDSLLSFKDSLSPLSQGKNYVWLNQIADATTVFEMFDSIPSLYKILYMKLFLEDMSEDTIGVYYVSGEYCVCETKKANNHIPITSHKDRQFRIDLRESLGLSTVYKLSTQKFQDITIN